MLGRVQPQKSFGDEALELHVSDSHFLMKVSGLVDWSAFDGYWPALYGVTGKPSSDPLVCFKMLLLEQWYNLSDPECEAQCADRLSFRRFLGLSLADTIPDETVLVRFSTSGDSIQPYAGDSMAALTQSQLDQLTRKLKENYQALVREVREELDNSGNQHRIDLLNNEPGDTGDESLANALADFNLTLLDRHIDGLRDIEAALQRIRNGEYGLCIGCGDDIGFGRLQAYPTAKRCIVCQAQHEKLYAQAGKPTL